MIKRYIIIFLTIIFFNNLVVFADTRELDLYNEWSIENSNYTSSRPFVLIRDEITFLNFWKKSSFQGFSPSIDFSKYMVFVWAPGLTRKDYSKVTFEKLIYKDGALLVLMDFPDENKYLGSNKRPLKAIIFPYVDYCDIFVFRKIKKSYKSYEWKHIYSLWNMHGERNRPFDLVQMDGYNEPEITLAKYSSDNTSTEKKEDSNLSQNYVTQNTNQKSSFKPITVVSTPKPSPRPTIQTTSPTPKPNNQPITFTQTSSQPPQRPDSNISQSSSKPSEKPISTTSSSSYSSSEVTPQNAPGMDEDPLFGSEFDITF